MSFSHQLVDETNLEGFMAVLDATMWDDEPIEIIHDMLRKHADIDVKDPKTFDTARCFVCSHICKEWKNLALVLSPQNK
jgi:hypothetical protein